MQAADGAHDMHADEGPCDIGPGFDNDSDDNPEPFKPMGAPPSEAAPQRGPGGVPTLALANIPHEWQHGMHTLSDCAVTQKAQ